MSNKDIEERKRKILNTQLTDEEELDIDSQEKIELEKYMPFFFPYLDYDDWWNVSLLIWFRLLQAIFQTANMAHPDEYWQVTQVAYREVYGDPANGYDIDLPWEFHNDYRLRNAIYPLIHVGPMWLLKTLSLDTNWAIRVCPYVVHSVFVIIGDLFLWKVGKQTVGKSATQVAFIFYLTNRVQNAIIIRCFGNGIEEILSIIAFYYYQKVDKTLSKETMIFTGLVSLQFMMRNTSPIGWIPLLFIKVFRDGAFLPFLMSAFIVAAPIVFAGTYLDSVFYSKGLPEFSWTFTGWNFVKINVIEGLSKYFGDHPTWFYLVAFGPAMFTVIYPFVLYAVYFYTRESLKQNKSPEIMYMTIFYFIFFSLIGHKEKRFLIPIFAFCVLALGYLITRKLKQWKGRLVCCIWFSIIVETLVHSAYSLHHKLWVFTDYMLEQGQPHSFFTMKRFDQPWYSNLHTPDLSKRTQVYTSQQNPDWFRRKYHTNLNLSMDRDMQLCIQFLADIEDEKFKPQYLLFEQGQCANSLYCFQACQHAVKNLGKTLAKSPERPDSAMYHHEVDFRTQYDFNHTTFIPFMKQTHLFKLNDGFTPK